MRVSRCDDQKQLVYGTLDSEPLNDYDGKVDLGSELAVSFSQIREHRKPTEFLCSRHPRNHTAARTRGTGKRIPGAPGRRQGGDPDATER